MKKFIRPLLPILDIIGLPVIYASALAMRGVRRIGVENLPLTKAALSRVGVFPIRDHYYEPLFQTQSLTDLDQPRSLPGIEWNIQEQLHLLEQLRYGEELRENSTFQRYMAQGEFKAGDAELWYSLIRRYRPARIFEIGSGYSTLIAREAIKKNQADHPAYTCRHRCIEPYERPWLDGLDIEIVREKVEDLPVQTFAELESGDMLFIDSSHMIRPQGDVLHEYLHVLPTLREGVIVHSHDIFSPRDYLQSWLVDKIKFWNEQYLLEAFLTCNSDWKVLAAVNYLHHHHGSAMQSACCFLTEKIEPGSFYMQKTK